MEGFIAFDSAWTDNWKMPGAICAAVIKNGEAPRFDAPRLTAFDGALCFIRGRHADSVKSACCILPADNSAQPDQQEAGRNARPPRSSIDSAAACSRRIEGDLGRSVTPTIARGRPMGAF